MYRPRFLKNDNIGISTKFAILFIIVGLIPLGASGIVTYFIYQSNIEEMTVDSAINNVEIVRRDIENLFGSIERILAIKDSNIPMLFFDSADDEFRYAKEVLDLFRLYRSGYDRNKLIRNIYVMGLNGKCLSERKGLYDKGRLYIHSHTHLMKILLSPDEPIIIPKHVPDYDKDMQDVTVVSMGTVLYNNITFEPAGVLVLDLDVDEIEKTYIDRRFMEIGKISLLYDHDPPDNVGPEVLDNWKAIEAGFFAETEHSFLRLGDTSHLFVNHPTAYEDLRVLGTISVNEMFAGVNKARNYFIVSMLVSVLLILYIYATISRGLMRPLVEVQENMTKAAGGNLDIQVIRRDADMIPELTDSFEGMLVDLKDHFRELAEEHRKYVNAELRVLQEQINPHFLYNTLDTILWSAVSDGNEEIVELVSEMSKFFRISLSKGADYVTVKDEVECIRSYLVIQSIRYRDILDYTVDVDETLQELKMLKLVLQPLVENCLYHGIKGRRDKGIIRVEGKRDGELLVFTVSDDGIGIEPDRLQELQNLLEDSFEPDPSVKTGVGLLNVQNRIKLKYGRDYGLGIQSFRGEGTTFTLELPVLQESQD